MISVVIPTYRKPALLERTLEALAGQILDRDAAWEVVVVDDGSGDETSWVLRSFGSRLPLRVVTPPSNEGRARARNRGWRAARGTWVLFLDDDIVLESGAVAAHVAAQRRHPAIHLGQVTTATELVDGPLFAYLDSRGIAKHEPGRAVPARYLLTQNVSIPRAALEHVGGFDENFGAYGFEDMELGFRLEDRAGLASFRLEGAAGIHVHHHSLDEYVAKKVVCGRETLPQLAELHPDRLAEMRLDLILSPISTLRAARGWFARLLRRSFQSPIPSFVLGLVSRNPAVLPESILFRCFDYLVMDAYFRGLRQRDTDNSVNSVS